MVCFKKKINKGVFVDIFDDIAIAINKTTKYNSKEHKYLHEVLRKKKEEIYQQIKGHSEW